MQLTAATSRVSDAQLTAAPIGISRPGTLPSPGSHPGGSLCAPPPGSSPAFRGTLSRVATPGLQLTAAPSVQEWAIGGSDPVPSEVASPPIVPIAGIPETTESRSEGPGDPMEKPGAGGAGVSNVGTPVALIASSQKTDDSRGGELAPSRSPPMAHLRPAGRSGRPGASTQPGRRRDQAQPAAASQGRPGGANARPARRRARRPSRGGLEPPPRLCSSSSAGGSVGA